MRTAGLVTASYNTRELTALLLWSVRRVLARQPDEIVVVDNGSTDGSLELLAEADRAGYCTLVRNESNVGHGPALNQGVEVLRGRDGLRWIWIVDSDCVIARPDALDAVEARVGPREPAIIGESHWDPWLQRRRLELYSLIVDLQLLDERKLPAFDDGGDPSIALVDAVDAAEMLSMEFPFTADGHIIHRGRASLAGVLARAELDHPLYEWAQGHHEPHYGGVEGAADRYTALVGLFHAEVGPDLDTFIDALADS